jgi:type I restriction enzyme M protein
MVRLSLVNLYLHGFNDPHIYEYDTLTSEERWNEFADVILANPPFMSPKGGIKPHQRFSIRSKRSEVLFVDYMAEHLSPTGRAAIIVPEGIIFQSQTAYKDLRRKLIDECLVAVVSLPAGCFNPYSGVKTSILIFDKTLARNSTTVGFFKVENDGFGLGAQRRPIDKNDLPQVKRELEAYLHALRVKKSMDGLTLRCGLIVEKERIKEGDGCNLSGERYKKVEDRNSLFELRDFDKVCTLEYGASLPKAKRIDGPYPVVGSNGVTGFHNEYFTEGPTIVVGRKGSAGEVTWIEENCCPIDTTYYVKLTSPDETELKYIYWILKTLNLPELKGGAGIPGLNRTDVYNAHKIPLPPLEMQKEIVAEIEGYQKVIDGARAVIDNYRPHIPIHPNWPMVELREVCELIGGSTPSKKNEDYWTNGTEKWISSKHIATQGKVTGWELISKQAVKESSTHIAPSGCTIIITRVSVGKYAYADSNYAINQDLTAVVSKNRNRLLPKFVFRIAPFISDIVEKSAEGIGVRGVTRNFLGNLKIPLPPLETQQAIVTEIEAEQALVNANHELIKRIEKKIEATLARVWGEENE